MVVDEGLNAFPRVCEAIGQTMCQLSALVLNCSTLESSMGMLIATHQSNEMNRLTREWLGTNLIYDAYLPRFPAQTRPTLTLSTTTTTTTWKQ